MQKLRDHANKVAQASKLTGPAPRKKLKALLGVAHRFGSVLSDGERKFLSRFDTVKDLRAAVRAEADREAIDLASRWVSLDKQDQNFLHIVDAVLEYSARICFDLTTRYVELADEADQKRRDAERRLDSAQISAMKQIAAIKRYDFDSLEDCLAASTVCFYDAAQFLPESTRELVNMIVDEKVRDKMSQKEGSANALELLQRDLATATEKVKLLEGKVTKAKELRVMQDEAAQQASRKMEDLSTELAEVKKLRDEERVYAEELQTSMSEELEKLRREVRRFAKAEEEIQKAKLAAEEQIAACEAKLAESVALVKTLELRISAQKEEFEQQLRVAAEQTESLTLQLGIATAELERVREQLVAAQEASHVAARQQQAATAAAQRQAEEAAMAREAAVAQAAQAAKAQAEAAAAAKPIPPDRSAEIDLLETEVSRLRSDISEKDAEITRMGAVIGELKAKLDEMMRQAREQGIGDVMDGIMASSGLGGLVTEMDNTIKRNAVFSRLYDDAVRRMQGQVRRARREPAERSLSPQQPRLQQWSTEEVPLRQTHPTANPNPVPAPAALPSIPSVLRYQTAGTRDARAQHTSPVKGPLMVEGAAPTEIAGAPVPFAIVDVAGNVRLDGSASPLLGTGTSGADAGPRPVLPTVSHRSASPRRLAAVPTKVRAGAAAVGLPPVEVHFCRGASVNPSSGGALAEYIRWVETGPVLRTDMDVQDGGSGVPAQLSRTAHSTEASALTWATEANSVPRQKEANAARQKIRALRLAADERGGPAAPLPVSEIVVGTASVSMPCSDTAGLRGRVGLSPEVRGRKGLDEASPCRAGRIPRDPAPERPGGSADENLMMSSAGALVMRRLVPAESRRSD
mmetsp:Transcript_69629/g.185400  ORF Transcript_69629/g.185400 Transcript_69629/m.185400 type:complete len:861 (-) Transcript_69629:139-2721(-)